MRFTGKLTMFDRKTGRPPMIIDIEKAACCTDHQMLTLEARS